MLSLGILAVNAAGKNSLSGDSCVFLANMDVKIGTKATLEEDE